MRVIGKLVGVVLVVAIIVSFLVMVGGLGLLIAAGTKHMAPEIFGWSSIHVGTGISYIGIVGIIAVLYAADRLGFIHSHLQTLRE